MDDDPVQVTSPNPQIPNQNDFQSAYDKGGDFAKKLEEIAARKGGVEREPHAAEASRGKPVEAVVEVPTSPEIEKKPDLAKYLKELEEEAIRPQASLDDYTSQVLLGQSAVGPKKPNLPLSQQGVQLGLHHRVWKSIKWLAIWCIRQAQIFGGDVTYKEENAGT